MTVSSTAPVLSANANLPALAAERASDAAQVEALIDRAFGPGRFAKTAERLREGRTPLRALSFTCRVDGELVGCVRQWSIQIGGRPAIFLGPFAVEGAWRSRGLGGALIRKACLAAQAAGHAAILLVGDAPYFEPLGFQVVERGRIVMPGPVDPRRLLLRALTPTGADDLEGLVTRG
jgi:predicted N-acetyltransferase YhbS